MLSTLAVGQENTCSKNSLTIKAALVQRGVKTGWLGEREKGAVWMAQAQERRASWRPRSAPEQRCAAHGCAGAHGLGGCCCCASSFFLGSSSSGAAAALSSCSNSCSEGGGKGSRGESMGHPIWRRDGPVSLPARLCTHAHAPHLETPLLNSAKFVAQQPSCTARPPAAPWLPSGSSSPSCPAPCPAPAAC